MYISKKHGNAMETRKKITIFFIINEMTKYSFLFISLIGLTFLFTINNMQHSLLLIFFQNFREFINKCFFFLWKICIHN